VKIEYKVQMCRKNQIRIPTSSRWTDAGYFSRLGYKRRIAAAKHVMDGEAWTAEWTQSARSKIGGILVERLMDGEGQKHRGAWVSSSSFPVCPLVLTLCIDPSNSQLSIILTSISEVKSLAL
jgi:hypothetical protein